MPGRSTKGTLLIDEMALSKAISLDTKTTMFKGFVDLGNFIPEHQLDVQADHALVFMFQPFRGGWVHELRSFLSKNLVTSQILHKPILECLLLLGEGGFYADVITMDGAQWDRGVWFLFGVRDGCFNCERPCDSARRLWILSDFPHLIKCRRNGLMKEKSFWTPNGTVMKSHWQMLLNREKYMKCNLRIAYKQTSAHLNPKVYQTINVPLAFKLCSDPVTAAIKFFKDDPTCPQLPTAVPTMKLSEIINNLIRTMMSRTPTNALRPDDQCVQKKVCDSKLNHTSSYRQYLKDFLILHSYQNRLSPRNKAIEDFNRSLRDWQTAAKAQNKVFPVSSSTVSGLTVIFGSTLESLDEHNLDYLMIAGLNLDALERFFGMMRNACGSNDHPDPTLFAQVFRLLASYSLRKSPKGGNVSGTEILETLIQTRESISIAGYSKEQWFQKIDAIIENGSPGNPLDNDCLSTIIVSEHDYDASQSSHHDHMTPHDYDIVRMTDEAQANIAGYVERKIQRFTRCDLCVNRGHTEDRTGRDRIIDLMDHYRALLYPSDQLFELTKRFEAVVLDAVGRSMVKINTLHQILDKVSNIVNLPYVGCERQHKELMKTVLNFDIVTRGDFLGKSFNENYIERNIKSKANRTNAKL